MINYAGKLDLPRLNRNVVQFFFALTGVMGTFEQMYLDHFASDASIKGGFYMRWLLIVAVSFVSMPKVYSFARAYQGKLATCGWIVVFEVCMLVTPFIFALPFALIVASVNAYYASVKGTQVYGKHKIKGSKRKAGRIMKFLRSLLATKP